MTYTPAVQEKMVIICYYLKRWHKVYSMKAADTDSALIILSWKVSIITARPPNAKKDK